MAKKETKTKQKESTSTTPSIPFYKDVRVKFVVGVFLIGFGLFLLVTSVSYFFTWQSDQTLLTNPNFNDPDINAYNQGGKFGFWLAAWLVGRFFGVGALFIPLIFVVAGLHLLRFRKIPFYKTILVLCLLTILVSITFGFLFSHQSVRGLLGSGLGGAHGYFIARWLSANIGVVGTVLILIVAYLGLAIYVSKNVLFKIEAWVRNLIQQIKNRPPKNNKATDDEDGDETTATVEKDNQAEPQPSTNITESFNTYKAEKEEDGEFEVKEIEFIDATYNSEDSENNDDSSSYLHVKSTDNDTVEHKHDDVPIELIEETEEAVSELKNSGDEPLGPYDPTLDLHSYEKPGLELLEDYKSKDAKVSQAELEKNKQKIVTTLNNYKIGIDKIIATIGPTVTLYEIVPKPGVRISSIKRLEDDIALSLSALGIRIIAPIPGKGTVGIEVPNENPDTVSMYSIIRSQRFQESKFDLPIALGKTISNETFVFDLAKMPHLLVAGATGQGKSVGLNAILTSLLYKKHPAELKLVLVDPKKVELTLYSKIEKHFLAKLPDAEEAIITDTQKVVYTLKSICIEMDSRYDLLKMAQVRNLKEYNEKFVNRRLNPEKGHRYLPYIVVVIDEFADLIMTAGREIEEPIARIAQLARAVGIHLIIATQRPTTNIITGLIKANFPARIAFRVTSMIDSRTILDSPGANQLIGRGDLLFSSGSDLVRIQCAFVDTPEVERITDFIGNQRGYASAFPLPEYVGEENDAGSKSVDMNKLDDLFEEAAKLVVQAQQGSTSLIQRKLSLGYNRAGRIMDQLEATGIVGPSEGSKARQVLISDFMTLDSLLDSLKNR